MKKLHLETLRVDSFATSPAPVSSRGTVAGHATGQCSNRDCPDTWDGTCWISCLNSCQCETSPIICD